MAENPGIGRSVVWNKREKGIRKAQGESLDGIMLVDKGEGETSFDVVKRVRKAMGLKKVGHAGTLDPFATGLLVVLLGQGTKLSPYLMAGEKRYLASMTLGVETDTLDPTGNVVRTKPFPDLDKKRIEKEILGFVGEIEQFPPAYSAVSVKGQRAYKLARKGIKPELQKRKVIIHSIRIIDIDMPELTMEVHCSSGTYIRSLASDMGQSMGTVARLSSLRRVSIGPFHVEDAVKSGDIHGEVGECPWGQDIISLKDSLPDMKTIHVDSQRAKRIRNGHRPGRNEVLGKDDPGGFYEGFVKIVSKGSLVAVLEISSVSDNDNNWSQRIRVFN